MVTTKDIAAAAGVSQSAVSAVLNGRAGERRIGKETADKIMATARRFNYQINLSAQNLRSGKSRLVGILLPIGDNALYNELIIPLEARFAEAGYYCSFAFWNDGAGQLRAAKGILSRRPAGVITVEPQILADLGCNVPLVSLLNYDSRYDCVEFDRKDIFTQAIDYFYRLGHRRIGNPDSRLRGFFSETTEHFRRELQKRGLSDEYMAPVVKKCSEWENARDIVQWYLGMADKPTAMMVATDALAIFLLREFALAGVRLPEDLSIISCDNIKMAQAMRPALTTFGDSAEEPLADKLAECFLNRLKDPDAAPRRITLKRRLVIRESAALLKK